MGGKRSEAKILQWIEHGALTRHDGWNESNTETVDKDGERSAAKILQWIEHGASPSTTGGTSPTQRLWDKAGERSDAGSEPVSSWSQRDAYRTDWEGEYGVRPGG